MRRWAQAVIDDLHLGGDETILDAGCGSGSVTFDLLERLPRGRIYAVDSSPDMISKITQAIEERGITNVIPIRADLTDFKLPEEVDVVFSNASSTGSPMTMRSSAASSARRSPAAASALSAP